MLRVASTVCLLICSNIFMTWAWYGHLKRVAWAIPVAIGVSWLIALPEYILQVPANRIGHTNYGGPFTAAQLKIIQEAITLTVFIGFALIVLKERPRPNEYIAFALIFAAVAVAMLGRTNTRPGAPSTALVPPEHMAPALAGTGATPLVPQTPDA